MTRTMRRDWLALPTEREHILQSEAMLRAQTAYEEHLSSLESATLSRAVQ